MRGPARAGGTSVKVPGWGWRGAWRGLRRDVVAIATRDRSPPRAVAGAGRASLLFARPVPAAGEAMRCPGPAEGEARACDSGPRFSSNNARCPPSWAVGGVKIGLSARSCRAILPPSIARPFHPCGSWRLARAFAFCGTSDNGDAERPRQDADGADGEGGYYRFGLRVPTTLGRGTTGRLPTIRLEGLLIAIALSFLAPPR